MVRTTYQKWSIHSRFFFVSKFTTYHADWIFPITTEAIESGYLTIDQHGTIINLGKEAPSKSGETIQIQGAIVPGFINCHCHLELSHLKKVIPKGTGLIPFINSVVRERDAYRSLLNESIHQADKEMYKNGIVAVGDISNTIDSFDQKIRSKILYHTFVEFFDLLNPSLTASIISKYTEVLDIGNNYGLSVSASPHAPYSVTKDLLHFLSTINDEMGIMTVHNQETEDELLLFEGLKGRFPLFYNGFGIDITSFDPGTQNAVEYILKNLSKPHSLLLVHNTLTSKEDLSVINKYHHKICWCTCPNANIYIENQLPDYHILMESGMPITIGTDSLASNDQLCIWSEIVTIHRHYPEIALHDLLNWGTINGAKYLKLSKDLGSLEIGKKPGIIQLENFPAEDWATINIKRLA